MIDILHQKPLLGRQINWAHPLAKGLVACWVFNEGSGNRVYDIASHKYDLDFVGSPVWTPGKIGHAIDFTSATPDYLFRTGSAPVIDYPFTMSCWVNPDNVSQDSVLIWMGDDSVTSEWWGIGWFPDATAYLITVDGANQVARTTNTLTVGVWHHVCGVAISSTERYIFLDATDKSDSTADLSPDGADAVAVGMARDDSPSKPVDGRIEFPMIWNRALTDGEVEWIFREPYAMFQQNRVRRFSIPAIIVDGQVVRLRAIEKY